MVLRHRIVGPARRTEEGGESRAGHGLALEETEIVQIQPERAVGLEVEEVLLNLSGEAGRTIGREAHEFVFAGVHPKTGVMGEGRVKQAERMGETLFTEQFQPVVLAAAEGGRGPLADAVEREDGGAGERRGEKRAGSMRFVMAGKIHRQGAAAEGPEFVLDDAGQPEFRVQPVRHGGGEGPEAARGHGEGRGEDALELQQRLLVVDHGVERPLRLRQTPGGGVTGKGGVMLDPRKAFLLGGRDNHSVLQQDGGGVVIVRAEPENTHQNWRCSLRVAVGGVPSPRPQGEGSGRKVVGGMDIRTGGRNGRPYPPAAGDRFRRSGRRSVGADHCR